MAHELLTPDEMAEVDRHAMASGPFDGPRLMDNAGRVVTAEILRRYPGIASYDVLCGPGNNGGDGYVVARLLREAGCVVRVWADGAPRDGSDAALAAGRCPLQPGPLVGFVAQPGALVVDALFGAGLARPLDGRFTPLFDAIRQARAPVVAVDLPSGLSGRTGQYGGPVLRADLTVTFVRAKPGHLLQPGRALCGDLVVADIGIPDRVVGPRTLHANMPALWRDMLPRPTIDAHKYRRGHVAVFSGGPTSTGAARLAAMGAVRAGAGAVTVMSPPAALQVNAAHLTSIMLRRTGTPADTVAFLIERKVSAVVIGPGYGTGEDPARPSAARLRESVLALLNAGIAPLTLVLDADAFTAFAGRSAELFATASGAALVLTPHEGEFARLFGDLAGDDALSKLDRAGMAARRAGAVVVLKGADTVVAAPDGRAVINANGTPYLATAGSGDVLAGLIAGLAGQGMDAFAAACAAVWMHAEAGRRFGPGLMAEDLPALMPAVLGELLRE